MAMKAHLTTSPDKQVKVHVEPISGDLRVRGTDNEEVRIEGDRAAIRQDEATITVECQGDGKLYVPRRAFLAVQSAAGDVRIREIEGEITLHNVSGDLVARDVGPMTVQNISADMRIRRASSLSVQNVGADATVREGDGDVHIHAVGADLFIGEVEGSCVVERVGSDLVLNMDFAPDQEYRFRAGSDVVCRVLPKSSVRFLVPSHTDVRVQNEAATQTQEDGLQVICFGEGEATVYIEAGSAVRLMRQEEREGDTGFAFDFDFDFDFNPFIDEKFAESMANLEERLAEQLSDLDQRLSVTLARQAEKAKEHAERIRRRAEKRADRLQKAAERRTKSHPKGWAFWGGTPEPPPPPPPAPEPVSDEERLTVLRMLEEGKISVEEAERLLAALEGQSK